MPRWTRAPETSSWRQISLSAWQRPRDPSVYGWLDVDVSRAGEYVQRASAASGLKVTLTHLVAKALALAIADCPQANALVRRGRVYLRDSVDIFFQVAYEGGADLSGCKVTGADVKSVATIARELALQAGAIRERRAHELAASNARLSRVPAPLRRLALRAVEAANYDLGLPLRRLGVPPDAFGSAMVTNVGTFGLRHGFAPLVPFSRVPLVLTVGAVHDAPWVDGDRVVVRPVLSLGVTFDHRVLDGAQAGQLADRFEAVLSDPERALNDA